MGYLDAIGANTFREGERGELVFAPWGRRRAAYVVGRDQAHAYIRFQRRYYLLMFIVLPLSLIAFHSLAIMIGVSVVWAAGLYLKMWRFTRGLSRASDIPVLSRETAVVRAATAMGSRTIATVGVVAAFLAAGSIWILLSGARSLGVWFGVVYFAGVTFLYAKRWWQLTRRGRSA